MDEKQVKGITKKELLKSAKKEDKKKLKEWSIAVKERDGYKCAYCGSDKFLDAHHLVPKEVRSLRYNIDNGVTLCKSHHRFSFIFSAHQSSFRFYNWFKTYREKQFYALREWDNLLNKEDVKIKY